MRRVEIQSLIATLGSLAIMLCAMGCIDGNAKARASPDSSDLAEADSGASTDNNGGSVGSSSGVGVEPECVVESDCADETSEYTARLSAASAPNSPLTLQARACEQSGRDAASCACSASTGTLNIDKCFGWKSDVTSVGRTSARLLYRNFPGCTPGSAESCENPCKDLERVIEEERSHVFDVEIRSAKCVDTRCQIVARLDAGCYAGFTIDGPMRGPFDCDLSNAAIEEKAKDWADDEPFAEFCPWPPAQTTDG